MKKRGALTTILTNVVIFGVLTAVFVLAFSGSVLTANVSVDAAPYYHGNTDKKNVTLMVNVYWGTEYIEDMLAAFEEYGVRTTFFVGGTWAEKNPETLKKIHEAGHEIGNHGYFHLDHKKISDEKNTEEILVCERMVKSIIGVKTALFAPPSGSFSKQTLSIAKELGYQTIMWSKDTIDWRDKDENLVYSRATKNLKGGDLILMHPTEHTAKALRRILGFCKENGFSVVTVSENIA